MDQEPRMVLRSWAAVCGGVLIATTMVMARQGVIHTRDGRTIEGDITEKEDAVTVSERGIEASINRADIDSISYDQDVEKEYQQRLAKLDKNDVKGRLQLARWAA